MERPLQPSRAESGKKSNLSHCFAVLEAVVALGGSAHFADIQRYCPSIPNPTLCRLLQSLLKEKILGQESSRGSYFLAERFRRLGHGIEAGPEAEDCLDSTLRALAEGTGQSAAFVLWTGDGFRLAAKYEIGGSFHYMDRGGAINCAIFPRHDFCLAVLSAMDPVEAEAFLDHALRGSGQWHAGAILPLLEIPRRTGLAHRLNEHDPLLHRLSAPVRAGDTGGPVLGAVGVSWFASEEEPVPQEYARLVRWASGELCARMDADG